ncbi:MAG: hypothetical protein ABIK92_03065 [Pseudomonadota bacterium]
MECIAENTLVSFDQNFIIDEKDTGAREDVYSGMCDCYCKTQGCTCDCHDCAFWQNGP